MMTKKRLLLIITILLIGAIGIWGFVLARHGIHLYQARQEVKSMLAGGMDTISPAYAFQLLNEIDQDLTVIDRSLGWTYPILNNTGKTTAQIQPSVRYLKSMVKYALLFEEKLAPIMDQSVENHAEMTSFLNDLLGDQALISQSVYYSEEITDYHAKIDIKALPFRFQDDFLMLEPFIPIIKSSGQLLPMLPEMVGMTQPAQYLLLALNHDELRGGGGFITAMGTATINSLVNIDLQLQDSYQVDDLSKDYPLPPQPLQDYMLAGIWVPRDGNWSADFPTSARTVQQLYELSTGQETRGVIAFDQQAVQQFLTVMGAIQVDPEQDLWVDASNVLAYMQESWGQSGDSENWWANRKDFVAILGKAMLQNLINTRDYKKMIELGKVSKNLLETGHLMVYFTDPIQQQLLADLNLDGAIDYQGGDFLYWVDSNIGFNKVDAVILRKLSYLVDLTDLNNPTARIIMQYEHPVEMEVPCVHEATYGKEIAYTNMFQRCYWDYWRVYTAPGSQLINAAIQFVPGEYLLRGIDWRGELDLISDLPGLNMVAGLQIVPTNSLRQIELDLALSPEILSYQSGVIKYQLNLFKQFGLNELPVIIKIKIPDQMHFVSIPENVSVNQDHVLLEEIIFKQENFLIFSFSETKQN
ncbi:MAG: DUF4012 domain-containing protein [Anaerolineaceae bacterium]|nr:DUF4012 domain-containing protein [Anaerolineaceae bacterium]